MMRGAAAVACCAVGMAALAEPAFDVGSVAGVYKERMTLSQVDGPDYRAENVLELVRLSDRDAYFRTRLFFDNGHSCDMSGVARVSADVLVYREHMDNGRDCAFTIRVDNARITFDDADSACRSYYCGMRGNFEDVEFALQSRRSIRYMTRLKHSREFVEALERAGIGR